MKCESVAIAMSALIVLAVSVAAQSGGTFAITQSVIAGGGVQGATGGTFSLDGTPGQAVAGDAMIGTNFAVTSGFWNFTPLGPTAASVTVGGRVRTSAGQGIQNAVVTLMSQNGSMLHARSSSFGYYRIEGVTAGETYIASISARRFTFAQPTIIVRVVDEISDLDFVAE